MQVNIKKTVSRKNLNFRISKKKIDALQALWISRTIYDYRFFDNMHPIKENWINR